MFVRRLTLENIRSIEALDIDFIAPDQSDSVRQWTLILGENGIGKSTVLRSLALLMAGSVALPKLLGDPRHWVRLGKKSGRISATIATQDSASQVISLDFKSTDTLASLLKRNQATLKELDAALKKDSRSYFIAGYGVSRRFASTEAEKLQPSTSLPPRAQNLSTLFRGDSSLRSIDSWAMNLHDRKGAAGLRFMREAFESLIPGVKFHGFDKTKRQLIFQTADGPLPLSELSDGFQTIISWFGDLLFRITETFPDDKKPLQAQGILLLDEVELHLHPQWQRKVIDFLCKILPHFQFLATTQSPLTAQQCGDSELYVLKRTGKQPVRLHHYQAAPDLLRIDQLLVSPIFGLETGMSITVEALRGKKSADLTDDDKDKLRSIPRPRADADSENEKIALLRDVRAALQSRKDTTSKPTGPRRAGATRSGSPQPARSGPAPYLPPPSVRPSDRDVISRAFTSK